MELSIKDRLYLPSLFAKEGSFSEFNLKKGINQKISISQKEAEDIGLKQDETEDRIIWDTAKETSLVVEFTDQEQQFLKKCCEEASERSLPDEIWVVVEKIYDSIGK